MWRRWSSSRRQLGLEPEPAPESGAELELAPASGATAAGESMRPAGEPHQRRPRELGFRELRQLQNRAGIHPSRDRARLHTQICGAISVGSFLIGKLEPTRGPLNPYHANAKVSATELSFYVAVLPHRRLTPRWHCRSLRPR